MSGATLTDRRYTGQRLEGTGLVDYGARFYDPALGRWAQPDSIIPDPANSLDFDRYQYVRGNPLKYVDPTGHKACSSDGNSFDSCTDPLSEQVNWRVIEKTWGIKFKGNWTEKRKIWVLGGVVDTGKKITETIGGTSSDAFRTVFSETNPLIFLFGTSLSGYHLSELCSGIGSGGCTSFDGVHDTRIINFWDSIHQYSNGTIFVRNVVHELGHVFNSILSNSLVLDLSREKLSRGRSGYAGGIHQWQFNATDTPSENFADMFVGWVYNQWGNDPQGYGTRRSMFMNGRMEKYLQLFLDS